MRKIFSSLLLCLLGTLAHGQIAIGSNTPDPSAALQIDADSSGFLVPRVTLASFTDSTTITSPAAGLLVYSTGSSVVTNGFYYWNGTKWIAISNLPNLTDLGFVLGWGSNVNPPNFMLPLSGGTYAWADYPEFQTMHTATPSQLVASSNATTFTLVDLNSGSRFVRGGSTAGAQQAFSTALPTTAFATSAAGAHLHSVDPPSTSTSTDGNHQHNMSFNNDDWNNWGGGNTSLDDDGGGTYWRATDWQGNHNHTVDIVAFNTASGGGHSHNIIGGDVETRPLNTSVMWCIKVKPTSTSGQLTIVNQSSTIVAANNGLNHNGAQEKLGGTLSQNTTIAMAANDIGFTGGEVGIGTAAPANKLELNSGTSGASGVRLTQMANVTQLGTDVSGNLYSATPNFVTARVNAGVPVTLGNLKVQCSAAGNRSLQFATTTGTINIIASDEAVYGSASTGSYGVFSYNFTLNTSWSQPIAYSFPYQGNVQRVTMTDVTNGNTYRIILIIGNGFNNNLIKIEKLNG